MSKGISISSPTMLYAEDGTELGMVELLSRKELWDELFKDWGKS